MSDTPSPSLFDLCRGTISAPLTSFRMAIAQDRTVAAWVLFTLASWVGYAFDAVLSIRMDGEPPSIVTIAIAVGTPLLFFLFAGMYYVLGRMFRGTKNFRGVRIATGFALIPGTPVFLALSPFLAADAALPLLRTAWWLVGLWTLILSIGALVVSMELSWFVAILVQAIWLLVLIAILLPLYLVAYLVFPPHPLFDSENPRTYSLLRAIVASRCENVPGETYERYSRSLEEELNARGSERYEITDSQAELKNGVIVMTSMGQVRSEEGDAPLPVTYRRWLWNSFAADGMLHCAETCPIATRRFEEASAAASLNDDASQSLTAWLGDAAECRETSGDWRCEYADGAFQVFFLKDWDSFVLNYLLGGEEEGDAQGETENDSI